MSVCVFGFCSELNEQHFVFTFETQMTFGFCHGLIKSQWGRAKKDCNLHFERRIFSNFGGLGL